MSGAEAPETAGAASSGSVATAQDSLPTAYGVLEHLVAALVKDPDAIQIELGEGPTGRPRLSVRVGPSDMGRVIGKRGRVAQAIRTVVRAAAVRDDEDIDLEVEFED